VEQFEVDAEVDATGLACPLPVIELARAVDDLAAGGRVLLRATDAAARVDVPVWCRMQRHRLLSQEEADGGVLHFVVEKAG
jgi:tRNA 2-thiouridine synthesizing protein A